MWNKLTDLLLKIHDLVRTTNRHTRQITELEKQFNDLQRSFERFALANQKEHARQETERKLLLSQIENLLLRQKLKEQERLEDAPPALLKHRKPKAKGYYPLTIRKERPTTILMARHNGTP